MSAERLREASALMREPAEAATPGPWQESVLGSEGYAVMGRRLDTARPIQRRTWVARCGMEAWDIDKANAAYIASWHPAVALAVADWLEVTATDVGTSTLAYKAALALADAYLGGPS